MHYYFSWVDEDAVFSEEIHLREDEKIFSLMIREEEGTLPLARVSLENPYKKERAFGSASSYCFIAMKKNSGEVQLLFKGRLVHFPTSFEREIVTLDFMALSESREKNFEALLEDLKSSPYHDPLFVPLAKRDAPDITDLLAAQPCHVFWDRTGDSVTLSDIVQGSLTTFFRLI